VLRNKEMQELYIKLVEEEHEEWVEEYYDIASYEFAELKELTDLLYVTSGLAYQLGYKFDKAEQYKQTTNYDDNITDLVSEIASGDTSSKVLQHLIYCIYGYAKTMGWDIDTAFNRVHLSNLSKLDDSGQPIRREDGKVLKGPNYRPPYLEDLTDGK